VLLDAAGAPTFCLKRARTLRIEGALDDLIAESVREARAAQALHVDLPDYSAARPLAGLLKWVSFNTGVPIALIEGETRAKAPLRARMAVAWGARNLLGLTAKAIGSHLNRRDHSTILRTVVQADALIANDPAFCNLIARLQLAHKGRML
jgi:chromosomal replication initiation ATPase DnaA